MIPISPFHPEIIEVISDSVGNPSPERLRHVMQSYIAPDQHIWGAFSQEPLIGLIGFAKIDNAITVRHLSVRTSWRGQGVGTALIQQLLTHLTPASIVLETDEDAVGFYRKIGFSCVPLKGGACHRYRCLKT